MCEYSPHSIKYDLTVDQSPAIFYSFSFAPNYRWSTFHPPGGEIVKYLQDVCEKYKIVDKIQCNTEVSELRYLVDEELWEARLLHLAPEASDMTAKDRQRLIEDKGRENVVLHEERIRAKIVCSAAGGLVEPNTWPDSIPGVETFEGDIFHSARWNDSVDLNGKDVSYVCWAQSPCNQTLYTFELCRGVVSFFDLPIRSQNGLKEDLLTRETQGCGCWYWLQCSSTCAETAESALQRA